MDMSNGTAVVTGGASGLGLGTVRQLVNRGIPTVLVDLPTSKGVEIAAELGELASFMPADITDSDQFNAALDTAEAIAPLRAVVHCAGRAATVRVLDKEGNPGDIEQYEGVIKTNLIGSFNVLRLAASRMVKSEPVGEERGVVILTASVAAWEGQIGQMPYASSKAGIVGMTLCAARDLARKKVRVNSIAPGIFDTPGLGRHSQEVRDGLAAQVPHPSRMGVPSEFGHLAVSIVENPMINGETIRIDGAIRMSAR
ncbi:SDR family NAD(P)-dependent oxidoreductase [Rhodococcus olei]|uniref:SDR family NAD(P)-dependent oxidoreductase n=1 Tax=Rhodococcus olei TaxID=2161675 RepID=A0ABP8NYR3_9NOCA